MIRPNKTRHLEVHQSYHGGLAAKEWMSAVSLGESYYALVNLTNTYELYGRHSGLTATVVHTNWAGVILSSR